MISDTKTIRCPYNPNHFMAEDSFVNHLRKCQATNKSDFAQCKYNLLHVVRKQALQKHYLECKEKKKRDHKDSDDDWDVEDSNQKLSKTISDFDEEDNRQSDRNHNRPESEQQKPKQRGNRWRERHSKDSSRSDQMPLKSVLVNKIKIENLDEDDQIEGLQGISNISSIQPNASSIQSDAFLKNKASVAAWDEESAIEKTKDSKPIKQGKKKMVKKKKIESESFRSSSIQDFD